MQLPQYFIFVFFQRMWIQRKATYMFFLLKVLVVLVGITVATNGASIVENGTTISVKSLSGPPSEFLSNRLPGLPETSGDGSNILMLEKRTVQLNNNDLRAPSPGLGGSVPIRDERRQVNDFPLTSDTGFSYIQTTNQYPHFSDAEIKHGSSTYQYDSTSRTISCDGSFTCDEVEANLELTELSSSPGAGVLVFSLAQTTTTAGTWTLTTNDPDTRSVRPGNEASSRGSTVLELESMIVFEDLTLDTGLELDSSCRGNVNSFCPEPTYGLVEDGNVNLALSVSSLENDHAQTLDPSKESLDNVAIEITDIDEKNGIDGKGVWHRQLYSREELTASSDFNIKRDGLKVISLPSMQKGLHSVRIDASVDVEDRGTVKRTLFYTLNVLPMDYILDGTARSFMMEDNQRLQIELGLTISSEKEKNLSSLYGYAEVWSVDQEKPIAWIGGLTHPVKKSRNGGGVSLIIDTRWLSLSNAVGDNIALRMFEFKMLNLLSLMTKAPKFHCNFPVIFLGEGS